MKKTSLLFVWIVIGILGPVGLVFGLEPASELDSQGADPQPDVRPALLLVEEDQHAIAQISWVRDAVRNEFKATMPYTAPTGGEPIGHNIKCYITMGGTRIETGAGHPKGAVVRLGVTKIDNQRAFFAGIDPGTIIEFSVSGVRFNQPVKYHEGTGMMHLKYALGDLQACALPATARNQYLLSDPTDTLGGRVIAGQNATPGALDGGQGHGEFIVEIDEQDPTLVSMRIRVPYGQLRHLQDPWKSDLPGTFFEPIHLHAEAEFIAIDAQQFNRKPIEPEINTPPELKSKPETKPEVQSD